MTIFIGITNIVYDNKQMHTHTHTHTQTHTHAHAYIHACTNSYTLTHTLMRIHTRNKWKIVWQKNSC